MKSPVGSHKRLEKVQLDQGLIAFRCPESGGYWIPAENYWKWSTSRTESDLEESTEPSSVPISEYDESVKLCPESGTVMSRFRVGHGQSFRVDRSTTGGIWLDGGEWEALKAEHLHRTIHLIFTSPWQKAVRDQERDESYHSLLVHRLGEDLFTRLDALKKELLHHPERAAALAYLNSSPKGLLSADAAI